MKLKWMETQDIRDAGKFDDSYALCGAGSHDLEAVLEYTGLAQDKDGDAFTGAFILTQDGDYAEVWLTTYSRYYQTDATYRRWELKRLPAWYKGLRGSNEYVADAWGLNLPAKSNNGHFHTDGYDLFSYAMKIGRTRGENKELLLAWGFSATTNGRVNAVRHTATKHVLPIKVTGNEGIVVGWEHPIRRDFWYYFPDEVPQTRVDAQGAAALVGKKAVLRHSAWGVTSRYIGDKAYTWTPNLKVAEYTPVVVVRVRAQPFADKHYPSDHRHGLWEVLCEFDTQTGTRQRRWFLSQMLAFGEFPVFK